MKRHIILITTWAVLITLCFSNSPFTYSHNTIHTTNTTADREFKQVWRTFSKAILNQDLKLIKSLSTDCILCADCVVNTPKEERIFKEFQEKNPDQWYNKLYEEYCYINIDKFIKEDLNIIFNEKVKSILLDKIKIQYNNNNHNAKAYNKTCIVGNIMTTQYTFKEVLLTYMDPTPQFEGSQWAFAFVKKNGKYKFCGFSTIP